MWMPTASPITSHWSSERPSRVSSRTIWVTTHSNATGLAATRGGETMREGAASMPAAANSSPSIAADVAFIASASGRVARFQTNSPVASAFATESFHPIEEKPISGGL